MKIEGKIIRIEEQRMTLVDASKIGKFPLSYDTAAKIVYWLDLAGFEIVKQNRR